MGKTQILIQTKKPETNCMKFRLIYQLSSKSERSLFAIIVSEKKYVPTLHDYILSIKNK